MVINEEEEGANCTLMNFTENNSLGWSQGSTKAISLAKWSAVLLLTETSKHCIQSSPKPLASWDSGLSLPVGITCHHCLLSYWKTALRRAWASPLHSFPSGYLHSLWSSSLSLLSFRLDSSSSQLFLSWQMLQFLNHLHGSLLDSIWEAAAQEETAPQQLFSLGTGHCCKVLVHVKPML